MKKAKKVVLALLCALLLIACSVAGTLAYLTSTTGTVTNTFSAGNVTITLDETKVDEYGVAVTPAARTQENDYKLIPGHTYIKDPTIHVQAGSEECWLFVKITNGISGIEANTQEKPTIATQMAANWTVIDEEKGIYAYNAKVDARTSAQNVTIFNEFTLGNAVNVSTFDGSEITIIAYAIQADGFATPQLAWAAAPTWN